MMCLLLNTSRDIMLCLYFVIVHALFICCMLWRNSNLDLYLCKYLVLYWSWYVCLCIVHVCNFVYTRMDTMFNCVLNKLMSYYWVDDCQSVQLSERSIVRAFNCQSVQLSERSIVRAFNCQSVQLSEWLLLSGMCNSICTVCMRF